MLVVSDLSLFWLMMDRPDDSWDVILRLKEQYDCITAIRFSRNFGKEDAISAGMEHARGNGVILMDADLQHPPVLLKEMIRLWREDGYEVVECIKSHRGKESLRNKWGSKFFYYLLNRLSGYDLKGATDYKLLDWKVVKAWRQMPERNTFFRGMVAWLGFRRAVLAFEVPERIGGQTNWNFTQLIRLAIKAIVSFSTLPLKAVSLIGVLFLLGAIVLGVQTLHLKMTGNAVTGFTTVILLQLMIGSIIMVSLGVIGEYIAAIYSETKGRPRYIVDEYVKAKDKDRIDS